MWQQMALEPEKQTVLPVDSTVGLIFILELTFDSLSEEPIR